MNKSNVSFSNDCTILVQGAIKNGRRGLGSLVLRLRLVFPRNPIVISTWGPEQCTETFQENVLIVWNPVILDEAVIGAVWGANFHRQCVTVISGLDQTNTPYVVKIRSDCFFTGGALEGHFKKWVTSKRELLVCPKLIRKPYQFYGVDWVMLGCTRSMREIWLRASGLGVQNCYYKNFRCTLYDQDTKFLARFHPEQILFIAQFGSASRERVRSSLLEFFRDWMLFEKHNYCVGRKNIQLECEKYKNRLSDWLPYSFTVSPLSFFRALISLTASPIFWIVCWLKRRFRFR